MVIRTYFDKNNTIIINKDLNTGLNPIAELYYGSPNNFAQYTRFLFHFDATRLIDMYTGGTFTDLTKLTHTLRLTNTISLNTKFLSGTIESKSRASSFDLILFKINQDWDNGVGYDYSEGTFVNSTPAAVNGASNWTLAQTGNAWENGTGVYSGSPSGITVTTQHFDKGNENIEMDITDYVNGVITGDTNYGLGIAFARGYEVISDINLQYVGFFTNNTQTFYEPFVESIYSNHIKDDRNNFFLDKPNKLYLYTNLGGNPTNLDSIPTVDVYDETETLFQSYATSAVTHVTKGVYSIDITVPTTLTNDCTMYHDVWKGIIINGVTRPDIELNIVLKNAEQYYNIGDNDMLPKQVAVSISGLKNKEKVKRGDIRKVLVSARIPYTVEQTQYLDNLQYRLYVTEGDAELTVVDFQPVELANNYYYFLIDSASLLPNTYYLDVLATSNLTETTIKNVLQFDIVNQVDLRQR